ncbi:Asp/Glu/hydantoin racemase [Verticiella sediminum]|uniref:Asp/Glu/hydantoin racemase n=1 Tax=Verticiella sediminum TaxID=1247510 RepID=A0A556AKC6_9BURK|nr:Asp/Glu/hydantoin racemase [Verticiella sediminum]TSH93347.1 Asp/Glu/hydantoin racemase [Verticiella sediminum]
MTRHLLGMLTPSSNTTLEPVTSAMVADVPGVSTHFSRFRVLEISLSQQALGQFDPTGILAAAILLKDARCEVIGWNGTSASWLGFDTDERLCERIEAETGAKACTSVLALNEALQLAGITRLGLLTPYRSDVQAAIVANYARSGIACTERHLGIQDNFSFSEVTEAQVREMAHDVMRGPAGSRPQALTVLCTNVRAATFAAELEEELGVPVYDSIATVVWKALRLANVETAGLRRWGSLFAL